MQELREAAKEAEELLKEIVTRKMLDQLPRENFWRECGAVREKLTAALDNIDDHSDFAAAARNDRLRESINEKLERLDEVP